jgi:hypothetical protein
MRISRHDLRRRYSNSLVINAGSHFTLRACSQATEDSIKAVLQLHKTTVVFFLQVLTSCILIASILITANLQTRESCLKLLHGECDYIIIIIIKNFVCSPKGFSAYNYNMQFKIKLYYTIQNLSYDCLLKPSYI